MRTIVIPFDGPAVITDMDAITLEAINAIVGGYIELVPMLRYPRATAYINEEGKIHNLPFNPRASRLVDLAIPGDYIAGNMLIVGAPDREGNDTELPEDVATAIMVAANGAPLAKLQEVVARNVATGGAIVEVTDDAIRTRLEELRVELRAECISYGELAELQGLAKHIAPGDVELLEAAGVPEHDEQ